MTALLLAQVFPPRTGGSGRWLWELYRRVRGLSLHVVAGHEPGDAEFDRAAPMPITRASLDLPNWGLLHPGGAPHYLRRWRELLPLVRRIPAHVLHCGKCLPEGLLALGVKAWTGIPFLTYAHGEELTLAATSRELRFLTRRVLASSRTVIANSHHTKRLLTTNWGVEQAKVIVMHPGVDTRKFVPAVESADVKARLGWSNRDVILSVGALQKRKGQDMLIRSLPAIRAARPDVLYSMVGQGWERPYLDGLVKEYGVGDCVEFRGVPGDTEMIECYQQCSIFALPNRQVGWDFEGFGIVSIEAQACGRPVIVGASGGTPETVQPDRTGEVVNCDTPDDLTRAAIRLLGDPVRREAMGIAARKWAVDTFDWEVLGEQATAAFLSGTK